MDFHLYAVFYEMVTKIPGFPSNPPDLSNYSKRGRVVWGSVHSDCTDLGRQRDGLLTRFVNGVMECMEYCPKIQCCGYFGVGRLANYLVVVVS